MTNPSAVPFLQALEELMGRYGASIAHEDSQGGFIVRDWNPADVMRLRDADTSKLSVPATPLPFAPDQISFHVLREVKDESIRAHEKHGDHSLLANNLSPLERLAALVEEVGEVAKELTYDNQTPGQATRLDKELVQTANVALSWREHRLRKA